MMDDRDRLVRSSLGIRSRNENGCDDEGGGSSSERTSGARLEG